jgi:hypothetical protein
MGTLLNVLVSLIAAPGTVPYISVTIRGNTKPRIVTWLTWARLTGVAGAASLSAGHLAAPCLPWARWPRARSWWRA